MEGTLMIKTYRGLLADGGQDKIRLTTTDGRIGYRIIKFQAFPNLPGTSDIESTLMVWKTKQATVSTSAATVDFSDGDLLAALYYPESSSISYAGMPTVVFDTEIFNQDIYITHTETDQANAINYYIELEQIKLSTAQAEQLIVKSLRGEVWTRP